MSKDYSNSEAMLARALKTIPLGTQTFSKSKTQYPHGVSPFYLARGKGSHVWDVDGNEYIDFVNSLAAINLGYCDPDVDAAVKEQMELGTIYSLPHVREIEVAEKIVELVPCAEMVRFGKNGSDATAGAVRLARAYTGRDRVAVCGYHGWQDWYIGCTTRNLGIPKEVCSLTHTFAYNDIDSLRKLLQAFPGEFAAVIMEPMNSLEPKPGFLQEMHDEARKHGALFILDETVTGFRYSLGGAQEYFGIKPDLATFGKGMANGYPISAVVGRGDVMQLMEEIFFSFTFGGELLSLTAALATMNKLQNRPVLAQMTAHGEKLNAGLQACIEKNKAGRLFSVQGHPTWSFFAIKDTENYQAYELKTLYLQEMFKRGVLTLGTHNMSYAHSDKDIETLLAAYTEIIPLIQECDVNRTLADHLNCQPIKSLFKIR